MSVKIQVYKKRGKASINYPNARLNTGTYLGLVKEDEVMALKEINCN